MGKCVECKQKIGIKRPFYDNHCVCVQCYQLDKYKMISKTKAMILYHLYEDDLSDLNVVKEKCSYGPATYFTVADVKEKACEVHNVLAKNLDSHIEKLTNHKLKLAKERKDKILQNKQNKEDNRKAKLSVALKKAGVELRNDSTLCKKYIEGDKDLNYSMDKIVKRMCQMKYLFEYCHMDECRAEAYLKHSEVLDAGYYPDCSVMDEAEDIALTKYSNGKYPHKFPWQK